MNPTIVPFETLRLAGLKTTVRSTARDGNDMRAVPELWQSLSALAPSLPPRLGEERYALITGDLPDGRHDKAEYHALFAFKDFHGLPPSLVTLELTKGRLAKFRHQGSPHTVGMTAMKVIREWLPHSKETLAGNLELFIYPAGYDRNDPSGVFDYCLILK